jgi:mutator protein MutT
MDETIEVAAGLIFRDGRLLIARRLAEVHLGGLWEFPGGKRLEGESFEACLRRELVEELGVNVEVGELIETVWHKYTEQTVLIQFYRCRLMRGRPRALGAEAIAWVTREELGSYEFPAADVRLLELLKGRNGLWED